MGRWVEEVKVVDKSVYLSKSSKFQLIIDEGPEVLGFRMKVGSEVSPFVQELPIPDDPSYLKKGGNFRVQESAYKPGVGVWWIDFERYPYRLDIQFKDNKYYAKCSNGDGATLLWQERVVERKYVTTKPNISFTSGQGLSTSTNTAINLGNIDKAFSYTYKVDDPDGDNMTVKTYLNDRLLSTRSSVSSGSTGTIGISDSDYKGLDFNKTNELKIVATDTDSLSSTHILRFTKSNSAPRFIEPTSDKDLGNKTGPFTEYFKVDDDDPSQDLTIAVSVIGDNFNEQINKIVNADRDRSYPVEISQDLFSRLDLNKKYTINIALTDGNATVNRNIYFTRSNRIPTIEVANTNLGEKNKAFSFSFTADDEDSDDIKGKVYLDGVQIEDLGALTRGQARSVSISRDDFIKLGNGDHKIRVDVTDSNGAVASKVISFSKLVTWYRYSFKQELEFMPTDIRIDFLAELKPGVLKTIEVCNNANDTSPTWETIEDDKWCNFANTAKTADKWAIGVKIDVDRDKATDNSYIYGLNLSFA